MTLEILAVLLLTLSAIILFCTEALRVDVVAILILISLALSNLVSPEQALSGFSNPATATVAAMFILSEGLRRTGVVDGLAAALDALVGRRPSLLYLSLLLVGAALSAFINNTAAVAVFIPIVLGLCRGREHPGRYLMPLSFAAQAGGVCTLIGTSTNILVSDIAARSNQEPFGMFEFAALGLCFVGAALLYLGVVAPFLLRQRGPAAPSRLVERYRMHDYLAELELPEDSPLVGQSLVQADLEKLLDVEVLEILRGDRPLWLPDPLETLAAGDVLLVRGPIVKLLKAREVPGLTLKRDLHAHDAQLEGGDVVLMEAVVPPGSVLEGRTLQQADFRRRHRTQALAIRHHDQLQRSKVGKARLAVGDVLLLQGRRGDLQEMRGGPELILMEEIEPRLPTVPKAVASLAVLAAVVGFAALGVAPILVTAMAGCGALVIGRILTVEQAYEAIDWKVVFLLAGVIPLGIALEQTGAASLLANGLIGFLGSYGPVAVLSALYLVTVILTSFMSNNATAALLAPLAIAAAGQMAVSPRPFLVAVTFAASSCFLTPIGYQTNAMVQGPGRYRFIDFTRVGAPLNLLFWVLATLLVPRFFPF